MEAIPGTDYRGFAKLSSRIEGIELTTFTDVWIHGLPLGMKYAFTMRRMTQRELATKLGVTDTIVSDYIAGRRPIPLDRRLAIASTLGCDLATLGW